MHPSLSISLKGETISSSWKWGRPQAKPTTSTLIVPEQACVCMYERQHSPFWYIRWRCNQFDNQKPNASCGLWTSWEERWCVSVYVWTAKRREAETHWLTGNEGLHHSVLSAEFHHKGCWDIKYNGRYVYVRTSWGKKFAFRAFLQCS